MDEQDKMLLAELIYNYPIHQVLDAFREAIENQVDDLIDQNDGASGMVKEMNRVAHHLSIFARG